jgi:hypothetical protein
MTVRYETKRARAALAWAVWMALGVAWVALLAPTAQAQGGNAGALYVQGYFRAEDLKGMGGAQAEVFVYGLDGAALHSGRTGGGWQVGKPIELSEGEYLVEVGRSRTRYNLRRVAVKAGQITELPTGWVAVTTWPEAEQPKQGCQPWSAELRAYVVVDGKEHLVASNAGMAQERGRVQLPVGTYRVYWHGLAREVEVQADKLLQLGTGGAGPLGANNVRIATSNTDEASVTSVDLCQDAATHVLAGSWWVSQVERIEDYPYERRVWQAIQVPPSDPDALRDLKPDAFKGKLVREAGVPLTPEEAQKLSGYQEGTLKQGASGGKFNIGDINPF